MVVFPKLSQGFSTRKLLKVCHVTKRFLGSGVYISRCQDIFQNLALEDWIYDHAQCENKNILLLWQNKPCVVIGRYQNPWTEVNLELLRTRGVPLARRKSGGGTVYHDLGNLNCTFFTTRKRYDRRRNLDLVVKAIKDTWNLDVKVNDRDDIMLNDKYKISGTAAKLSRRNAYHHFTLLINVDKDSLFSLLTSPLSDFSTKATESVRSEVINLVDVQPDICQDDLIKAITAEYYNSVLCLPQVSPVYLDPTQEDLFPGIDKICTYVKSWAWKYGWTPKFTIVKSFSRKPLNTSITSQNECLHDSASNLQNHSSLEDAEGISSITIELECNKGCIEHVRLTSGEVQCLDQYRVVIEERLKGVQFNYRDVDTKLHAQRGSVIQEMSGVDPVLCRWIFRCILSMTVSLPEAEFPRMLKVEEGH